MTYPGGKNGGGAYQRIINFMPPHKAYIEAFLGSGAIIRNKRPALINIGIDRSIKALDLCFEMAGNAGGELRLLVGDALELLPSLKQMMSDRQLIDLPETLIYLDPPYLPETRKGGDLYEFELSYDEHVRLLDSVIGKSCMVMISGYRSELYDEKLWNWHRVDYKAVTRQGMVDEALWMNFKPPTELHDYRYLGENYRERERIKRKKQRWASKLEKMDRLERLALMDVLNNAQSQMT